MGGGIAGWLTPGWYIPETRLAPHIHKPDYVESMLKAGEDPKPQVIDDCKKECTMWRQKLDRCEAQLEDIAKINPTKSCIYPFRDWVTCIEACAQPVIHNQLEGAQ